MARQAWPSEKTAIHGPLCEDMDCHGAARLAMTQWASLRPHPVIARHEAIHDGRDSTAAANKKKPEVIRLWDVVPER
jgi:hypothetical protein